MRRTRIGCGVFVVLERHAEPSTARLVARGAPRVDFEHLEPGRLPIEVAVSAITMAEIAAGPHPTGDAGERARRHDRVQRIDLPMRLSCAFRRFRPSVPVRATGSWAKGTRIR